MLEKSREPWKRVMKLQTRDNLEPKMPKLTERLRGVANIPDPDGTESVFTTRYPDITHEIEND